MEHGIDTRQGGVVPPVCRCQLTIGLRTNAENSHKCQHFVDSAVSTVNGCTHRSTCSAPRLAKMSCSRLVTCGRGHGVRRYTVSH